MCNQIEKFDIDTLVKYVLIQEGLLPFQTPFRITSPAMANWNTILGFPISHDPKPDGRTNFIFLKNQDDVAKAVKQQFINYSENPIKYGLPENPTVGNAINIFDQSGTRNKIKYLEEKIPDFNKDELLKDII